MSSPAAEVTAAPPPASWREDWVVSFDPTASRESSFRLSMGAAEAACSECGNERLRVVFTGVLLNRDELTTARDAPAALVLAGVERLGMAFVERLRGPFGVFVFERDTGRLHVATDHIGIQPLYRARVGDRWFFSGSPLALSRLRGVGGGPDPVVLAEYLCGWYPVPSATGLRGIERVPPATVMTVGGAAIAERRYWDPSPEHEAVEWLSERELERFDEVFERAVARCAAQGPSAVFLSGGLDSIGVASAAADWYRARGQTPPRALSLAFPEGPANESHVQEGVARQLGLPQDIVSFADATRGGLVRRALEMSASWPVPMWNVWAPAYERLAERVQGTEVQVLLTGRGGDEWMALTPYLAADLVRTGDVTALARLLRTRQRSHHLRGARAAARLLWTTAGRPLASAALDAAAPEAWHRRRRQRLLAERPSWVAPAPPVRAEMDRRVDGWIAPARPPQGFYVREMRTALLHPAVRHDLEETQEFGRRIGLRVLHPFWDVDLVTLLYRTPPKLLMQDGQAKWPLRRRLAERLPGLGLERRAKVTASGVFVGLMRSEARSEWERLGGVQALGQLGVVDTTVVESAVPALLDSGTATNTGRAWTLLTLETWARQRLGEPSEGERS